MRRIGEGYSRRYFVTGERFNAEQARHIGLIHEVVPDANALDLAQDRLKGKFIL